MDVLDVPQLFARVGKLYLDDRAGGLFGPCARAVQEVTDTRVVTDLLATIGDRPSAFASLRDSSFEDADTVLGCLQEMLTHALYGVLIENPYIKFWEEFSLNVEAWEITQLAEAAGDYFLRFSVADDGSPQTVESAARAIMALKWKREVLDHVFMQLFSTAGVEFKPVPKGDTLDDHLVRSIAEGVVQLMLARPDIRAEQERRLTSAH